MAAMKTKHQRLVLVLLALVALIGAAVLAMSALKDDVAYFYTPSEALAQKVEPGRAVRLGGMVVGGSLQRAADGVTIRFEVTDGKASLPVTFTGVTPDLFREGSGVVADGSFDPGGTFAAKEILAKHDERYMPRELEGMAAAYNETSHQIEQATGK